MMRECSHNLLEVIEKVKESNLTRDELNFLISRSYQISISFLKAKFKLNLKFLNSEEHNMVDIAMDAIVPLFVKNNFGQLGICRSLENWNDTLENISDADYFLSRIIWRRVDQTVTKVLKERDPIFEKILKTLNFCIQKNKYKKISYFGTVFVLENPETELFGEIIDEQNFNLIPEAYFGLRQADLFNKLFEYLFSETNYYSAIPLNLLVKRIKFYHTNRMTARIDHNGATGEIISLNEIVDNGLKEVKEKLDVYYVQKDKLNKDEAELIYSAFSNISKDMLSGQIHDSLYLYLKDYRNSLTREQFYSKYLHIMNYLLSQLKSDISNNIYF